jgi:MATE family multidrug resistance protein
MAFPADSGAPRLSSPARPYAGGVREVARLAYPVALTQLSISAMNLVDSAIVGRLGATELGAVGFGNVWLWTLMCVFVGTGNAVQTFVAQHHGAGEPERCGAWAWQGLFALVPVTALASAALFAAAGPLLALLGPSPALTALTTDYVCARSFGNAGLAGAVVLAGFFRGLGDTHTPLYAILFANAVNAVLDYGLVFGELGLPALGIAGAGIATAVAEWLYFGALFAAFRRPRIEAAYGTARARPSGADVRRLLRIGLPIGGQWWLEMVSFAAFSTLVARMGDEAMAASQAFLALLSLSFMQALGLGTAVATLVGRYAGARNLPAAERSFDSGVRLGLVLAVGIALLFGTVPDLLLRLFTSDPEVLALGRPLVRMGAVFQIFDAVGIIAEGALRGAGDTRWPFAVRFALAWGLFLPLAWTFGVVLEGGLTGAWLSGLVHVVVLTAALTLRFRSGAWHRIRI